MESIYSAKIYKYANVEMWQQLKHRSLMGHSRTKSLYCRMVYMRIVDKPAFTGEYAGICIWAIHASTNSDID